MKEDRCGNRLLIWGTGRYAETAVDYIEYINSILEQQAFQIVGFVDNNSERVGALFRGVSISPAHDVLRLMESDNTELIIAVKNDLEIRLQLDEKGIKYYISFDDFIRGENLTRQIPEALFKREEAVKVFKCLRLKNKLKRDASYREIVSDIGIESSIGVMFSFFGENVENADEFVGSHNNNTRIRSDSKNLAILSDRFFNGGVERVLSHLMKLFIDNGYRVTLITMKQEKKEEEYHIPSGIKRFEITKYQLSRPVSLIDYICDVAEILNKECVDILCTHLGTDARSYYLGLLAAEYGIMYVPEKHMWHKSYGRTDEQLKLLYKFSDTIVVLSKDDEQYWSSLGFRSKYIPNPTSKQNNKKGTGTGSNTILWIGRIDNTQKNVCDTVDVISSVIRVIPDAMINIVGAADDQSVLRKLRKMIQEQGMEEHIKLCGFHTDVSEYYKNSGVLIMTSSFEGFPMTLAEAMSYGLPVVMYELPYLELVKRGKGVVVVPQRDTEAMAKEVIRLLQESDVRERLSTEAKEVIDEFAAIDLMKEWKDALSICEGVKGS